MKEIEKDPLEGSPGPTDKTDSDDTPKPEGAILNVPYVTKEDGLYFVEENGDLRKLCSHLKVTAFTRDESGSGWGRLVQLQDPDGEIKDLALPMNTINSPNSSCLTTLSGLGLILADQEQNTKKRILNYLNNADVTARMQSISRPGWHGLVYVMRHRSFGKTDDKVVLQNPNLQSTHATIKGSLSEWQENIGQYLPGNSRLMLAASAAFAAPLLYPLGETESGGINFFGGSSIGKTTALLVAGSIWGGGGTNGYLQSWRATDNGLEYLAEAHCDSLLCLDEIGQVNPRLVGDIAYMLANGEGKVRARKDGGNQRKPEWRLVILSSGEQTLADKISEGGHQTRAGQETRLVDIPADAGTDMGIIEDLHGYPDPGSMVSDLKRAARSTYGAPMEMFLNQLIAILEEDDQELFSKINGIREGFESSLNLDQADGQVSRVARKFSLIAAAGEIAVDWGVLPGQRGDPAQAAKRCFSDWIKHRGGNNAGEETAILGQLRHFLETKQYSRFIHEGDADKDIKVPDLAGFKKTFGKERWPPNFGQLC